MRRYLLFILMLVSPWAFGQSLGGGTFGGGTLGVPGTAAAVSTSPSSLAFGDETQDTTSAAQSFTLTNTGGSTLTITSIVASSDYEQSNDCGSSLTTLASCTVDVTFTPTITGADNGSITITTNAASSPDTVSLTGTGTATLTATVQWLSSESDFGSFTNPTGGGSVIADPTGTAPDGGNVIKLVYGPKGAGVTVFDENVHVDGSLWASPVRHVFVRYRFYLKSPNTNGYIGGQRKTLYLNAGLTCSGAPCTNFALTSDTTSSTGATVFRPYYSGDPTYGPRKNGSIHPTYDAWHCGEFELYIGSASGAHDGYVNMWVDGVKDTGLSTTGWTPKWFDSSESLIKTVAIGNQLDTYNFTDGYPAASIPITAIARTANVVSMTTSYAHLGSELVGPQVIVTGVPTGAGGTSFNGVFNVTAQTSSTAQWSQTAADDIATPNGSSKFIFQGDESRYFQFLQIFNLDPGFTAADVPTATGCK